MLKKILFLKNYVEVKGQNIEVYKEVHEDLVYMPVLLGCCCLDFVLFSFDAIQSSHSSNKKN